MLRRLAGLLLAVFCSAAQAQPADTVLLNGKIVTFDSAPAEALAVRDGRIAAIGRSADIRVLAGPATRVVDLGGRAVIPGLIDSHIHAIRAGPHLHHGSALDRCALDSRSAGAAPRRREGAPKGAWLVVAGGWVEEQFAERRRPTQAEVASVARGHPVYVQLLYSAVLLTAGGIEALGITSNPELASRLTIEAGPDGKPTGWISADNRTTSELFDRLPRPSFEQTGRRHACVLPHTQ